jgi:hypothetical protein
MLRRWLRVVHDLRGSGLDIGLDRTLVFLRGLRELPGLDRDRMLWVARATLTSDPEHFARLVETVDRHFGRPPTSALPQKAPPAPRHDPKAFQTSLMSFMAERARADMPEVEVPDCTKVAIAAEALRRRDFATLSDREKQSVLAALGQLRWRLLERPSRRRVPSRRGDADRRRLLRRAAKGPVVEIPRRAPKLKRRPLVLLADVSGSMELYTRLLLTMFHGLTRVNDHTETFVFGTRLTRITVALRRRSVDDALDDVARAVPDFAGGTRIGESLRTFNTHWARTVLKRGAVVVVVSDGWEAGDVHEMQAQLRRIHARCHRLVWLNPLLGRPGYAPEVAGMAAALKYVDDFMPVRNLESLAALADHLARLPSRKGHRPPVRPRAPHRIEVPCGTGGIQ